MNKRTQIMKVEFNEIQIRLPFSLGGGKYVTEKKLGYIEFAKTI